MAATLGLKNHRVCRMAFQAVRSSTSGYMDLLSPSFSFPPFLYRFKISRCAETIASKRIGDASRRLRPNHSTQILHADRA